MNKKILYEIVGSLKEILLRPSFFLLFMFGLLGGLNTLASNPLSTEATLTVVGFTGVFWIIWHNEIKGLKKVEP